MSNVVSSAATPAGSSPTLTPQGDPDFERRWAAWRARGAAHDAAVRRRFMSAAQVGGAILLAAFSAYILLS